MEIVRLPEPNPAISTSIKHSRCYDGLIGHGDIGAPGRVTAMSPRISRIPPLSPLTRAQRLVALMVGMSSKYSEVAETLGISCFTVKRHAEDAAAKIPGDLPTQTKLIMWVRGASLEKLNGSSLQVTVTQGVDSLIDPEDAELLSLVIRTSDRTESREEKQGRDEHRVQHRLV